MPNDYPQPMMFLPSEIILLPSDMGRISANDLRVLFDRVSRLERLTRIRRLPRAITRHLAKQRRRAHH